MFGFSKKKKIKRIDTLIDEKTEILGDVKFSGGMHIDGIVKGDVIAENDGRSMFSLGEGGMVEGEINVPFLLLSGTVVGDVYSREHLQLSAKAKVNGDIYYNLLEMAVGAQVSGKLIQSLEAAESTLALDHDETVKVIE